MTESEGQPIGRPASSEFNPASKMAKKPLPDALGHATNMPASATPSALITSELNNSGAVVHHATVRATQVGWAGCGHPVVDVVSPQPTNTTTAKRRGCRIPISTTPCASAHESDARPRFERWRACVPIHANSCQTPPSWGQVLRFSPTSWGQPIARVMGPPARCMP